jgi:hypothetical protein
MQVLSPTALASGACGLLATWALAKPGAGRGSALRSMGACFSGKCDLSKRQIYDIPAGGVTLDRLDLR